MSRNMCSHFHFFVAICCCCTWCTNLPSCSKSQNWRFVKRPVWPRFSLVSQMTLLLLILYQFVLNQAFLVILNELSLYTCIVFDRYVIDGNVTRGSSAYRSICGKFQLEFQASRLIKRKNVSD